MFNADRLLFDLIGGGLSGGGLGPKRYRHNQGGGMGDAISRTVLSPQGLTILGGLAVAAYEHFKGARNAGSAGQSGGPTQSGQANPSAGPVPGAPPAGAAPAPSGSVSESPFAIPPPFLPPPFPVPDAPPGGAPGTPCGSVVGQTDGPGAPAGEERARLLITAMVSAAKADGAIDQEERVRILRHLAERGAGDAERAFLEEEMARPLDLDRLISQVHDPMLAAEVYAASLLAIDPDTPAETAYLAVLSTRLNLEPGLIQELESRLDATGA
jgi:uncharacterized membrane protein YebE (DUF533 family)